MALRSKIVVVPNALELDGWNPTPMCGSPDGIKRIFWQGGSTHAEDWTVCINGVEQVMKELADVRLVILGFLPPVVMNMVLRNNWQSRVEYMGFSEPETYYQMVKCVRAEVGLAPLQDNRFNAAKSELKFIENTVIGMPTVASNVEPYYVIEDGKSGMLARDDGQWYFALKALLTDKHQFRKAMLSEARKIVNERFDIQKVALQWAEVLCQ
jgi:glycosyltransferase involved in cell wall biosynthesis